MTTTDPLYAELKPEIGLVANELFQLSEAFLRKNGNFLCLTSLFSPRVAKSSWSPLRLMRMTITQNPRRGAT